MTKRSLVSQMVSSDSVRKDEHSIGVEMPYEFLEGSSLESRMSSKGRSLSSQLSHLSKMKREVLLEKDFLIFRQIALYENITFESVPFIKINMVCKLE